MRGNVLETRFCLLSVVCDDVEVRFEVCSEIWIVKKWQGGLVVVDHINLRIVQRKDSLATLDLFEVEVTIFDLLSEGLKVSWVSFLLK